MIKIGDIRLHNCEGKTWRIRVTSLPAKEKKKRREWVGVLVMAQHGLLAGSECWGYVDELTEL